MEIALLIYRIALRWWLGLPLAVPRVPWKFGCIALSSSDVIIQVF